VSDLQRKAFAVRHRRDHTAVTVPMTPPDVTAGSWRLAGLADGYLITQLLYAAAELRLADVLAAGPVDGSAVAGAVGADPDTVTRILRGLCAEEVFAEDEARRFSLGPLGGYLRDGVPGSQREPILARARCTTPGTPSCSTVLRHERHSPRRPGPDRHPPQA
jgi:hypothetical protein